MEYAIKPSSYISGLCYSILRLEPFDRCGYGCIYCYARWYRGPHGVARVKPGWPRVAERLARLASRVWPRPWFRLSTLSEPFQEVEAGEPSRHVARVLRLLARNGVPVVVNTRSASVARGEVLSALLELADRGLVVVQVSLSPRGLDRLWEPGAPSTWRRLEALEALAEHGVPVAARLQPAVPGLEEELHRLALEALDRGAMGLIAESLRETGEGLRLLYRLAGLEPPVPLDGWEPYQLAPEPGRTPLLHPPLWWRERLHHRLRLLAARSGALYAPCKDGPLPEYAWPPWRPGRDCCHLAAAALERGRRWPGLLLRPTLHEYLYWLREEGGVDGDWEGFIRWCEGRLGGLGYRCGGMLEELPGWIAKPLRLHERRLRRLVERKTWPLLLGLSAPRGAAQPPRAA